MVKKNKYIFLITGLLVIFAAVLPKAVLAAHVPPEGGGGGTYGTATHRAAWYPEEPNVYVEVKLDVIYYSSSSYFYYTYSYKVGSVWCVSNIHPVETSLKYNTPEPGITTATVHRRFAYWFLCFPIVVDIKCQVHFDENTGLFYYSEIVRDNGAAIAQALMEEFPFDSLYQ